MASKSNSGFLLKCSLSILIALGVGVAVFFLSPDQYQCTGSLHIRSFIADPITNGVTSMPAYDDFVQTQIIMLNSERCRDLAMGSARWLDDGKRSNSPDAAESFKNHLKVTRDREVLSISFVGVDSKTASDGVHAIIESYIQLMRDTDPDRPEIQESLLQKNRTKYETELAASQAQLSQILGTNGLSPEVVKARLAYKIEAWNDAESKLKATQAEIEQWQAVHAKGSAQAPPQPDQAAYHAVVAVDPDSTTLNDLTAKAELEKAAVESARQEALQLSQVQQVIENIQASEAQPEAWLQRVRENLENLRVWEQSSGRIEPLTMGERPEVLPLANLPRAASAAGICFFPLLLLSLFIRRKPPAEPVA